MSPRTPVPTARAARTAGAARVAVRSALGAAAGAFTVAAAIGPGIADAQALGGQWYAGAGAGGSRLEPDDSISLSVDENAGTGGTLFLGRDLDGRASVQLQLFSLGEAEFGNGRTVGYRGGEAGVLYRFFDTRDANLSPRTLNLSLYGRFGLGYLERDTDVPLDGDSPVYFGAGAGLELGIGRGAALRLEGIYHDTDAGSGWLSALFRFGDGRGARPPARAPSADPAPPEPAPALVPAPSPSVGIDPSTAADVAGGEAPPLPAPSPDATTAFPDETRGARAPGAPDVDDDGVPDALDTCPASTPGFPVRDDGCSLLDGVLSGASFVDGGSDLLPGATDQLDFLAATLAEYPRARIELHAHTDDFATPREQAILTRARLRTAGTYLVGRGVAANRLVLRSFGGSRPIASNDTPAGRERNNRIEVLENAAGLPDR